MPLSDQRSSFAKDAIRQRLLLHIQQMWGVRNLNHLDSFVRMLVDILANEVYKVSNDFMEAESRVLERMADLLTPDILTIPRPAHAIMQASPAEPEVELLTDQSFLFQQKYASQPFAEQDSQRDLFFSAAGSVKLLDGRVAYLASGAHLYAMHPQLGKRLVAQARMLQKLTPNTLWIGLDLHPGIESLDRTNFYFEWPTEKNPLHLFSLLALSQWSINGFPLPTAPGPAYGMTDQPKSDQSDYLLSDYDLKKARESNIRQIYHGRFIHLTDSAGIHPGRFKSPYPADFGQVFEGKSLEPLKTESLLWIQVVFPAYFDEAVLENVSVVLNAFPVLNRKNNRILYRTKANFNLLPLRTEPFENLLLVRTVMDSKERVFTPFPSYKSDRISAGSYAVRRGGIERFDVRNAREQLAFLLELLRDESMAFAVYGQDTVQVLLTQLQDQIGQLERKVQNTVTPPLALSQYVLFTPFEEVDTMQVDFWTTNGELANRIPAGTPLLTYSASNLKNDQIKLLTTTTGGSNRPSPLHRVQTYRYALMTHQRIVTLEDIRTFFFHELGPLLKNLTIRKGVATGKNQKEGLMRTVDITLHPAEEATLSQSEWEILLEGLHQKLLHRSGQVTFYRIFLADIPTHV